MSGPLQQLQGYRAHLSLLEHLVSAWAHISRHRLRSTLTALGVLISVTGLVALAATMAGLEAGVNRAFKQTGSDLHQVGPNFRKLQSGHDMASLGEAQWRALKDVPGLRSPVATRDVSARVQDRDGRAVVLQIRGVDGDWPRLYRQRLQEGRFIVPADVDAHQRVVVLSPRAVEQLKLPRPWLAQSLVLAGRRLQVVGVLQPPVDPDAQWITDFFVPLSLAREMAGNEPESLKFAFALQPGQAEGAPVRAVEQALRQSLRTRAGEESDFRIESAADLQRMNQTIIAMLSSVMSVLVSISLLVGGVGIMNVMLVAVQERVHEIGLLRALGATQRCIRTQFLCEAGMLSLLGALVGALFGTVLGNVIVLVLPNAEFSLPPWWALMLSLGSALLVGLAAGALPAQRAAELDPVQALHQP